VAPFRCLYNWDLKLIVWDNFGVHTKYAIKEFLQRFEL
jgi:hypothetical protein